MAAIYVNSVDGNDADDGSTWALAKATVNGASLIDAAGDTIWISDNHAESTAGALALGFAGTLASPVRILCGNDAAEPPTALATTGSITTTGTAGITINGSLYVYGLTLSAGTGAGLAIMALCGQTSNRQVYDTCTLILGGTNSSSVIAAGSTGTARDCQGEFINCTFQFGATTQRVGTTGWFVIRGGGASAGGSDPANFITAAYSAGEPCNFLVDGFDFSNWGASLNLIGGGAITQCGSAVFRNCKLPASWSGGLWSAAPLIPGFRAEMINCSAGDVNYALWVEDYTGSIKHETTIVRTGGATENGTAISWKMEASANNTFPMNVLRSPVIVKENTTVGSAVVVTVEIVHDSVTALDDDEIWLEVQYLGTSGFPLSLFADDAAADVLATPAAQTTSTVAWTTTGITNVNKQKLSVSVTPQEVGEMHVTVCLALASKVVYVDPPFDVASSGGGMLRHPGMSGGLNG